MADDYDRYVADVSEDIRSCIEEMGCQPILFVGSGITKRYLGGPNWEELLQQLAEQCPEIDRKFAYYKQRYNNPVDIGAVFTEKYNEWAWGEGESEFPKELFDEGNPPDIYIKHAISVIFKSLVDDVDAKQVEEIELLRKIHPHSIITTNYDQFLESVFVDYEPIVGQKILYANHASIGEVFKIHGCVSDSGSIIINRDDYDNFTKKKKYLSAKLLAFFAEHPLVFIGYSAEDQNIRAILSDIDEILSENGELIPNIYILEWSREELSNYQRRERLISVSENKSVRVKSIIANDFSWVFGAFAANEALENVNPKLLRALLARTYSLVRSDIPKNPIEVDYKILSAVSEVDGELAKLYGIANAADGTAFNANYPHSLTAIGKALGFKSWHNASKLIEAIKNDTGIDIRSSDNIYHCAIMNGQNVQGRRYSSAMLRLLEKVRKGEAYELELKS